MNTPHASYVWQMSEWPNWIYDPGSVQAALSDARLSQGQLLGAVRAVGLSSLELDAVVSEIWVQEALSTAAIEGQTLDMNQVRSSVMRKISAGHIGSSQRHIDGLIDMMESAISSRGEPLDEERLCGWQASLFPTGRSGTGKIEVGQYRTFDDPMQIVSGPPGRQKVHYRAPASKDVPREMAAFLGWFNASSSTDSIVKAAIAHLWFETIHPFEDGNGRVGRAIIDRTLAQGIGGDLRLYSMSRQIEENRKQYYDMLNQAQTGNLDVTAWVLWFAAQFSAACQKSLAHVDVALEKARYWASHAAHEFNVRQVKVLKRLLEAGDGGFLGGLTREKYAKIASCSDATATRDLVDLLAKGALRSSGTGKGTKYVVNVPGWNADPAGPSAGFLEMLKGAQSIKPPLPDPSK